MRVFGDSDNRDLQNGRLIAVCASLTVARFKPFSLIIEYKCSPAQSAHNSINEIMQQKWTAQQ